MERIDPEIPGRNERSPQKSVESLAAETFGSTSARCRKGEAVAPIYQPGGVRLLRDAIEFSGRLVQGADRGWGPNGSLSLCTHGAELALQALRIGLPPECGAALVLADGLRCLPPEAAPAFAGLETKFGLRTAELTAAAVSGAAGGDQRFDAIAAAGAALLIEYDGADADDAAVRSFVSAAGTETAALRLAGWIYKGVERRWGSKDMLPLSAHAAEVALLLACAGQSADLVAVGALHDFFEDYAQLSAGTRTAAADLFQRIDSEAVSALYAVTEPAKSVAAGNWKLRKETVLKQIAAAGPAAALLSCATKISTFAAGNEMMRSAQDITQWSAAGLTANLEMADRYRQVYQAKGVPAVLLTQLDDELRQLSGSTD